MKKIAILLSFVTIILLQTSILFAQGSVSLSVQIAPPDLLNYEQPPCPGDGYMWQPGYWAYGDDGYGSQDYYWVPGVWVLPPQPGFYWTPNYWEFSGGFYRWHHGYWGPQVGYYGGVNYGYGYFGVGFGGGRWEGGRFHYNTAVVNINTRVVHNTYVDRSVNVRVNNNRSSFYRSGGEARPASREHFTEHTPPTLEQSAHHEAARTDHSQFANVNHQRPATSAMTTPTGTRFDQDGHQFTKPEQHHDSEFQSHNIPHQQVVTPVQRPNPIQKSQPIQMRSAPRQAPSGGRKR